MLPAKTHLMTRLTVLFSCSLGLLLGIGGNLRAEPGATGAESASHSGLGEVIQTGARLFGKAPQADGANRVSPDMNAKGTSSTAARKAAIAALPVERLSPENRQKVGAILKSVSFFRQLPKVTFAVEPEVYNYFVAHPDAAVSIWRSMKISKLQMWQTGRFDYEADTGDGSVGTLEVLHTGGEMNLVTCDGLYKSPLFTRPIEAKSLLLLQTSFSRDAEGTTYVTHCANLFVSFPSQTMDVVSKIFSPLAVTMTDRTFTEVSLFLKMMSLAMARRPDWVEQVAANMDGVADIRKDQVLELNAQVHSAARKRAVDQILRAESGQTGLHEPGHVEALGQVPPAAPDRRSPSGSGQGMNREPSDKPGTTRITSGERGTSESR
jgi:hypothetical protein